MDNENVSIAELDGRTLSLAELATLQALGQHELKKQLDELKKWRADMEQHLSKETEQLTRVTMTLAALKKASGISTEELEEAHRAVGEHFEIAALEDLLEKSAGDEPGDKAAE